MGIMFPERPLDFIIAGDTETFRIGPGALAPKLVCSSFAWRNQSNRDQIDQLLLGNTPAELESTKSLLVDGLKNPNVLFMGHQMSYDMAVWWHQFPELGPLIFAAYADLRIYDTKQAERQRNVSRHGEITFMRMPDGSTRPLKYHLDDLGQKYLGKSRTAEKMDPAAWRLNYDRLDGIHADHYPPGARAYALEDALDTLLVGEAQIRESAASKEGYNSIDTTRIKTWFEFSYALCSLRGMKNNLERCQVLSDEAERIANWKACKHMMAADLIIPPKPPRPYANGRLDADGNPMMTKGDPKEHERSTLIQLYILTKCLQLGMDTELTETGEKLFKTSSLSPDQIFEFINAPSISKDAPEKFVTHFVDKVESWRKKKKWTRQEKKALEPWSNYDIYRVWAFVKLVSTTADFVTKLSVLTKDPLLQEYERRCSVAKLRSTVFPNILGHPVVYASFDFPKKTQRGASKLNDLVPSIPAQQMPGSLGGIDPRVMIEARDGFLLVDSDYKSAELCTVAQTTWDLFKDSGVPCEHRNKINADYDLHAYLGSALGARAQTDKGAALQSWYREQRAETREARYEAFNLLKSQGDDAFEIYSYWRTYAKPVGLGYPGRLGPATMVEFSAATYRIPMTLDDAKLFRHEWLATYPEMELFFRHAKGMRDPYNMVLGKTDDGRKIEGYAYQTPLGTWRRGCKMTDLCNGVAMQSPAADGFHLAFSYVQRACYDPSLENVLYGGGVVVPFHDQLLVEVPAPTLDHARACAAEVERLMVFGMKQICPDVKIAAEPILCSAWSKKSKELRDDQGRLLVWHPEPLKFHVEEAA